MNQVKGTGASSTLFQHDRPNKPQVSRFDLSRKVNFSLDVGMIVPIDLLEVYPGDKFRIGLKMALDTLPLVAPSLTNYKIVTHWYYQKKRDLWKGWKTFSTKGRSGNVNLTVPQVDLNYPVDKPNGGTLIVPVNGVDKKAYGYHYAISNHSLSSFLGVPPSMNGYYGIVSENNVDSAFISKNYLPNTFKITNNGELTANQVKVYNNGINTGFGNYPKVSAPPFVMYQSICKHFYVNPNLLQDNTALFPVEGDDYWILPYTIANNVANYISGRAQITAKDKINVDGVYSNDETDVDLRLLRYAMFDDDYFTTALKDLQRGNVTTLDMDASDSKIKSVLDFTDATISGSVAVNKEQSKSFVYSYVDEGGVVGYPFSHYSGSGGGFSAGLYPENYSVGDYGVLQSLLKKGTVNSTLERLSVSMTANQMRSLLAMSVWQERICVLTVHITE